MLMCLKKLVDLKLINMKITEEMKLEIRKMNKAGIGKRKIAQHFGFATSSIWYVLNTDKAKFQNKKYWLKTRHKRLKPQLDSYQYMGRTYRHGMTDHPLYGVWYSMISRCDNPKDTSYRLYGARGIRVCKNWYKIENFLKDMGDRPNGTSIDRIDVNGDYSKTNCRWATRKEQALNTRRNIDKIKFSGKLQTLSEWSDETGIPYQVLYRRLFKGKWSISKALTTEILTKYRNHEYNSK